MIICTYTQNKHCTSNCSPLANQCPPPHHFQVLSTLCHLLWNIPLTIFGQPSWFCPLPAPCVPQLPSLIRQYKELKNWNVFGSGQHCSVTAGNTGVLSALSFSLRQKIAPHQTLWRKNQLHLSWNEDNLQSKTGSNCSIPSVWKADTHKSIRKMIISSCLNLKWKRRKRRQVIPCYRNIILSGK